MGNNLHLIFEFTCIILYMFTILNSFLKRKYVPKLYSSLIMLSSASCVYSLISESMYYNFNLIWNHESWYFSHLLLIFTLNVIFFQRYDLTCELKKLKNE